MLPSLFDDASDHDLELLLEDDEIHEGGAVTAYAKTQFEEVSEAEMEAIRGALFRYCELDTFAMVMIYEAWKDMVKNDAYSHRVAVT